MIAGGINVALIRAHSRQRQVQARPSGPGRSQRRTFANCATACCTIGGRRSGKPGCPRRPRDLAEPHSRRQHPSALTSTRSEPILPAPRRAPSEAAPQLLRWTHDEGSRPPRRLRRPARRAEGADWRSATARGSQCQLRARPALLGDRPRHSRPAGARRLGNRRHRAFGHRPTGGTSPT